MTFNPAVPLAGDSPAVFPAQNSTNFTRLQTLLGADHQFNNTAAANDGYHNLVHLTQQAPASSPLATIGRVYAKASGGQINLFYMDDAGTEYQITPTMPIRAAVNFAGNGAIGAQAIRSSYNVTSVTKTANGAYTVVFPVGVLPDADYIVQITGMRDTAGLSSIGSIRGGTYGTSVTATTLLITFSGETNSSSGISLKDVVMGNVTVFSIT